MDFENGDSHRYLPHSFHKLEVLKAPTPEPGEGVDGDAPQSQAEQIAVRLVGVMPERSETPEQMLPGVIDSLTTCSASQELAADPPKPNAIRFVVETAAKKEDGTKKEVDVDEYKKNLAAALGVSEEKVAVIEKIKHKVKATYVLKQTLDEFESSGMRAKIITKIATAAIRFAE